MYGFTANVTSWLYLQFHSQFYSWFCCSPGPKQHPTPTPQLLAEQQGTASHSCLVQGSALPAKRVPGSWRTRLLSWTASMQRPSSDCRVCWSCRSASMTNCRCCRMRMRGRETGPHNLQQSLIWARWEEVCNTVVEHLVKDQPDQGFDPFLTLSFNQLLELPNTVKWHHLQASFCVIDHVIRILQVAQNISLNGLSWVHTRMHSLKWKAQDYFLLNLYPSYANKPLPTLKSFWNHFLLHFYGGLGRQVLHY